MKGITGSASARNNNMSFNVLEEIFQIAIPIEEIEKDGKIERLTTEVAELRKSNTQLIELVEHKDLEISEKNATINFYVLWIEATRNAQEKATERVKCLQDELEKSRNEGLSLHAERDKLALEANFARERFDSFMKEFEHQRTEMNSVLARNVDFSQLLIDYQRKLRENSESVHAAEERSRKLNMDVTVLKHEKEMLINAEKRTLDEVRSLSERVHHLQASLDTIQSAEQAREVEARVSEKKKQEEHTKQIQRDWAEAWKEMQVEPDNVQALTLDREHTFKNATRQVEEMGKDLANALCAILAAETRAALAETKQFDLEKKLESCDVQDMDIEMDGTSGSSSYNELNKQNKTLHSRTADHDTATDARSQNVISYLRRSKEIAEREISLLEGEKLQLQSQLESALKATENAQSSLSSKRASSKSLLFMGEVIKSVQLQVRDRNLLLESNVQLREENKHNLEEFQKLRDIAHEANVQAENLERLLKERQIELEACKKEIEIQKLEKENLEKRVSEFKIKQKDSEIEEFKKLLSDKQETVSQLEQDLPNSRLKLSEREEEELSKENQALSRQLEEVKQGKRHLFILLGKEMLDIYSSSVGDTSGDQTRKQEKDTSQPVPQPLLRKRQASSSSFGSHEESAAQGETGADVAAPLLKKFKGSDSPKRSTEGQSAAVLENVETLAAHEDFSDVADLPQGLTEEAIIVSEKE